MSVTAKELPWKLISEDVKKLLLPFITIICG
jgi:hypothetical protein